MKLFNLAMTVICAFGAWGAVSVHAQDLVELPDGSFTRLTARELSLILEDVREKNPMVLKRLEEDPEMRQAQLDNLRELMAFANQAQRVGLAKTPLYRNELSYIRNEVTAQAFDRFVTKRSPASVKPTLPFSRITSERIAAFWKGTLVKGNSNEEREKQFEEFFRSKVELMVETDPSLKDRDITEPEKEEARQFFAKIAISVEDYNASKLVTPAFREKLEVQIKLQQAQFLAKRYAEKAAPELTAFDEDIDPFVRAHPEYGSSGERRRAEEILARAKAGEDFAQLANELSEDPGNKNDRGEKQGGLYRNVKHMVMVAPLEIAALKVEAGQIYPEVVESAFGFHIIKLERKGKAVGVNPDDTYDVRHILVSTDMLDPDDPTGSTIRRKDFLKIQIETDKKKRLVERLVTANRISVPDDFETAPVPVVPLPKASTRPKARVTRKRT